MKKLLLGLSLFLLCSNLCYAQTFTDPVLGMPRDSVSNRINFMSTMPVAGATQAELYKAAKNGLLPISDEKFTATIDVDDPATGRLVGTRYLVRRTANPEFSVGPAKLKNTMKFAPVAGGYRCEVTDFIVYTEIKSNIAMPLEAFSDKRLLSKKGTITAQQEHWNEVIEKIAYDQGSALNAAVMLGVGK